MVRSFKKNRFLLKFHFVISFCSEGVGRSAYTVFPSAFQELSSQMNIKIIWLAAKKLQHDEQASFQLTLAVDDFTNKPAKGVWPATWSSTASLREITCILR